MESSSMLQSKKRYNVASPRDLAEILNLVTNSDIELSDDEDGDILVQPNVAASSSVRVGADKIRPLDQEIIEPDIDSDSDIEADLPLLLLKERDQGQITEKGAVKWCRQSFVNLSETVWSGTEPEHLKFLSPLAYFEKYIGETLYEDMATYTNMYALQQDAGFKPTCAAEIKALFGLHIAIGSLKLPRVRLFWNKGLRINLFNDTMSRDRFFKIRSNLHCVDNLQIPENCQDRMYKVRPLFDAIRKRCLELDMEENLCIDEQIVPFRGKLAIKQYIKGKPTPWGVKIFVLCGRSGLAYDFLIYQGATTGLDPENMKNFGLGASVVLHLSERVTKEGHKLYYDNYFSSFQLLEILKQRKIFAGGTIRLNRFSNPPLASDKDMKKIERGSHDELVSENGAVILVKWLDNRSVCLASNFVGCGNEDEVSRWDKKQKKYVTVKRPEIVRLYNHSMGGVDLLDQMIGLYRIYVRSRKWTLRMIFHAVDLALANSWFEYRRDCKKLSIPKNKQLDFLDFRLYIADCLCKVETNNRKRGRPSNTNTSQTPRSKEEIRPLPDSQHDGIGHLPHLDGNREGKRSEYARNHVDRVRLNQLSSTPPGCPIPGSRRRQTIAHHLDLATTQDAHQYYPYLQFNQRQVDCNGKNHLNLQDYYSHIQAAEPQQFEEHYYESYENNYHDKNDYPYLKESRGGGNNVCSLRRTRSLAVIREETYNDLHINSTRNSRRSQLIPRAKLVNRSFAKERHGTKKRREEDSTTGSGVDTQTSDTRESDDYYTNLKRLDSVKIFRSSWQTEKSDLESIDSDYFKNSQHQPRQFAETTETLRRSKSDGQFQVLEIELHQESSVLPETTTSNSDHSDSSTLGPGKYSRPCTESEGLLSSDGTLTSTRETDPTGKPVISYDSVYLSSEDSSGETLLRSAISTETTTSSETDSLTKVSIDNSEIVDRLYTKVQKSSNSSSKPKILSVTTKRGVLERLTSISTSQILKTNDIHVIENYRPNLLDNHYHSLPDINIGRSLKASERIDAKLRSSYKRYQNQNSLDNSSSGSSGTQRRKRARQREFSEIDSLASANVSLITVDDSIFSNGAIHEKSSLVETERQQSEIEITEETLLPGHDSHAKVVQPAANISPETHSLSNGNTLRSSSPQTDFLLNHSTQNFPRQLRIIVTDSQNNIIEEDSIESAVDKVLELPDNNNNSSEWNFNEISNSHSNRNNSSETAELKDSTDSCQKNCADQNASESEQKSNEVGKNQETATCCPRKGILKKDCRRNRKAEIHFPPPPLTSCTPSPTSKTKTFRDIFKTDCPIIATGVYSNDEQVILKNFVAAKMSRPQVLHVIDSKRHQADRRDRQVRKGNVEKEFLQRVDSARCYWSKITTNDENEPVSEINSDNNEDTQRNFVKSLEDEVDSSNSGSTTTPYMLSASKTSSTRVLEHGLESFCPTVEIIELSGEKQATIVKACDVDNADFDHVRYKVMKPKEFQKDILNRSKKEAQFDGLIQYLQDYSFQELLSNNNIVIIEPVRTKIEKPSESAAKLEPLNCKITGGSGTDTKSNSSKHHFFYQPVRVNRELLEEELPNPDTVRNVRKFFEDHVLQKQSPGTTLKSNTLDSVTAGKRRGLRYLTIDTSYGGGALRKWDSASLSSGVSSGDLSSPCECNEDHHHHHHHHHHQQQHHSHGGRQGDVEDDNEDDDVDGGQEVYTSEENLCDDEMCGGGGESYYVSEDVLEKIRECGSTVTYYGGRVVNNRSPELSPMTRAIMQEIHGKDVVDNYDGSMKGPIKATKSNVSEMCSARQPNNCLHNDEIDRKYRDNKHLGIQFKLVKSNSCSSRLELVGTDKCTQRRSPTALLLSSSTQTTQHNEHNRSPSPTCNPEESVRELVNRLESGTIKNSSAPRIIESKCIEKSYRRSLPPAKPAVEKDNGITINNHHIGTKEYLGLVDIINHVTVNNHMGWNAPTLSQSNSEIASHTSPAANVSKVPRNKNVDLAFTMNRARQPSKLITSMTPSTTTKSLDPLNHTDSSNTTNETNCHSSDGAVETCSGQGSNSQCENNKIDSHSSSAPSLLNDGLSGTNGVTTKKDDLSTNEKNEEKSEPKTNGCEPAMTSKVMPQNGQQPVVASPTAGSTTPIKLLEKHYVANDRRLIEQRKYDEIEFEEFEVYSPGMVCHDQKDSNKQMNGDPREDAEIFETFEERI